MYEGPGGSAICTAEDASVDASGQHDSVGGAIVTHVKGHAACATAILCGTCRAVSIGDLQTVDLRDAVISPEGHGLHPFHFDVADPCRDATGFRITEHPPFPLAASGPSFLRDVILRKNMTPAGHPACCFGWPLENDHQEDDQCDGRNDISDIHVFDR